MQVRILGTISVALVAMPAMAQQTGTIVGKVVGRNGQGLANVRIEVSGNVLPQVRTVVTSPSGEYRVPFLPPGEYVLTYSHPEKATQKRPASVVLNQTTTSNLTLVDTASAQVEVIGEKAPLLDTASTELKTSFSSEIISSLPVGHDYRDLVKLIPGVTYTEDAVRAPSAGGSGQDNVHQFDGVNVNLPFYGTMSSEPSGHDIDQVTVNKGGADATGFNRSAGYTINSVSKSGTNALAGELIYQVIPDSLVAHRKYSSALVYDPKKTYTSLNVGGPLLKDRLFYFVSVYHPTVTQANQTNNFGPLPEFSSSRNEYFGKLTWAPLQTLLIHASYRDSKNTSNHSGYGSSTAPTVGDGAESKMKISTLEASWNVTANSFINFKTTNFILKSADNPDYRSPVKPVYDVTTLDVSALATQGQFTVPTRRTGTTAAILAYNTFVTPLIAQYGWAQDPTGATGGGSVVGGYREINNQNFFRRNHEISYEGVWGGEISHTLHAGVQWYKEMEDLYRVSNGWGSITAPFNTFVPTGLPNAGAQVYFQAAVNQQGISGVPAIHSEYESLNYEVNDKIRWRNYTFNVGFVMSNDKMYGSGLAEDGSTVSGYVAARGHKYLEHEVKASDTFQPRLGVTWNYQKDDTVYFNYARFVPSVSSLPRASSWDRNLATTVNVYFNQTGQQLAHQVDASSTGKLYASGLKPRHTDEFLIGTTKDFGKGLNGRFYARYRKSVNFWEDTNNGARVMLNTPDGIPKAYYIPNLYQMMNQLTGTTYADDFAARNVFVIAQLDNAFTKYYEVGTDLEWRGPKTYVNASYTWSHYYGNFDQDNTTTTAGNDSNIFVGSSNIADDFGRQLWNNKYGNLSGDRRHKLKVFGSYELPWQARVGAYFIYQSGQPWQLQDYTVYTADRTAQGSTSTSDTNRYAEPAGSRRTRVHYQVDLTYNQIFWKRDRYRFEGTVDMINVFNRQTGYNVQSNVNTAGTGLYQSYFLPRRTQFGLKFTF